MDPNVRVLNPLNKYRAGVAPVYPPYGPGAYPNYGYRNYKMNQSLSPVRFKNDFGLDNSRYQDPIELSDKKGYITDNVQPA